MSNPLKNMLVSLSRSMKPHLSKFRNKYPRTYRLYLTLKKGTNQFTKETILFLKIKYQMARNPNFTEAMSLNDVHVYRQVKTFTFILFYFMNSN